MNVLLPRGQVVDFNAIDPIVDSIAQKFFEQERFCQDCWSFGCLYLAATLSCDLEIEQAVYLALCQSWWQNCLRSIGHLQLDKHLVEVHGEQPWAVASLLQPASTENLPNYFGGVLASGISYFAGFTQMAEVQFLRICESTRKEEENWAVRAAKQATARRAERTARKDLLH